MTMVIKWDFLWWVLQKLNQTKSLALDPSFLSETIKQVNVSFHIWLLAHEDKEKPRTKIKVRQFSMFFSVYHREMISTLRQLLGEESCAA